MISKSSIFSKNRTFVCVVISVFVLIVAKQVASQILSYLSAEEALVKQDYVEAVDNYVEVIYNHVPFSPLEKISISKCLSLLELAKTRDDNIFRLYVLEQLRRAIYGVRHFATPHSEALKHVEDELASLRASMLISDGYLKPYDQALKEMKTIMSVDLAPNTWKSVLCISFFSLYIYMCLLMIRPLEGVQLAEGRQVFIRGVFAMFIFGLFLIFAYLA